MNTKVSRFPARDQLGNKCVIVRSTEDLNGTLLGSNREEEEKQATYRNEAGEELTKTDDPDKLVTKDGRVYTFE